MQIIPVILSGGSGTRLWPLSRKQYPKQYLPLAGDNTMLQETILRLSDLDNLTDPIIICNADHRFLVAEQCQQIDITNPTILLEPIGRNTAPAITAAALQSLKQTDDAVLLVLSADKTSSTASSVCLSDCSAAAVIAGAVFLPIGSSSIVGLVMSIC